jgi:putative methionine-R-sulfoxide reductase with GAF domain
MAQNPSFPWMPIQGPAEPEYRNESPQRQRLRAVFSAFRESGAGTNLALDILLHELAEESLAIAGVTGAAIALRGDQDDFVCRAVAGEPAPPLGARIEAQDGLSAECVRTGRLQVCHDTESDPRVNAAMCRDWGVRSLVIAPVFLRQKLVGILEMFSPIPNAFDRPAIDRLTQLGNYVVETVTFAEGPVPPPPATPAKSVISYKPRPETRPEPKIPTWPSSMDELWFNADQSSVQLPDPQLQREPPPAPASIITSVTQQRDTSPLRDNSTIDDTKTAEARAEASSRVTTRPPAKREDLYSEEILEEEGNVEDENNGDGNNAAFAEDLRRQDQHREDIRSHDARRHRADRRRTAPPIPTSVYASSDIASVVPPPPPAPTLILPTPPTPLPPHPRRNLGLALVVLAAGFIAVVSLWSWWPSAENHPVAASEISTQPPKAPRPSTTATADHPLFSRSNKPTPARLPAPAAPKTTTAPPSTSGALVVYEKGKVVFRALPGSRSMIGPTPTDPTSTGQVTTTAAPATGPVTSAAETEKLRDTSDIAASITGGKLIHQVDPLMPQDLASLNLPKEVLLEGVIDRDGTVRDLRLLRGDSRLAYAAIEAVRQWRYEPFRSNGERVDMLATLSVHFK